MKTMSITMLVVLAACLSTVAQENVTIKEISNDNGFEAKIGKYWKPNAGLNIRKPGGTMALVPGGKSGKCLEVKNTPTSKFHLYSLALIPVSQSTDTIKLSVEVKGKGTFAIGCYCYQKDKKFVTSYFTSKYEKIDSKDWVKKEFVYDFRKLKAKGVGNVRIAFEVKENGKLQFDNLSGVLETTK